MRHVTINAEDRARNGGPWCNACQAWTDVDQDREQNVCRRCGRPTVEIKPPAWVHKATVQIGGKVLSPQEAHAWFEKMRQETEQTKEE